MTSQRIFAIGDIHGCSAALMRLDQELKFSKNDLVITLGDYVDRGPDSRGVIEHLITLSRRCQLVPLRGNHEIMMLDARQHRQAEIHWLHCGGDSTMQSYAARSIQDIPHHHWQFLENTLPYYETETDFFVHANSLPDIALAKLPDEVRYWMPLTSYQPHHSGKRMICGHTSQNSGFPLVLDGAVCIDTYLYGGQWLTCLETHSNQYYQTNQNGDFRVRQLPSFHQ